MENICAGVNPLEVNTIYVSIFPAWDLDICAWNCRSISKVKTDEEGGGGGGGGNQYTETKK